MAARVPLIRIPVSVAGMVLTTISAALFIVVLLADLFGLHTNPYRGLVFFLVLPALFVVGLLLIPFGAWLERRRSAAGRPPTAFEWPRIDLNNRTHRTTAIAVFALTIVNIVIVALGAYKGVEYMDSAGFCGQVCHTPMQPQFVAHQLGPHAGVTCASCHVGSGAGSFLRAKLAGTRQLVAIMRNSYHRPIVAAPDDLVSSRITCAQCHAPRFHGDVVRQITEYAEDEANTVSTTTVRLHVGGTLAGRASGIHWHADPKTVVEYIATDHQQTIPWVKVTDRSGVREYTAPGAATDQRSRETPRRMDCTDCHNRPGHPAPATAGQAVDRALARGDIPATLPFVRREAVAVLAGSHSTEAAALEAIARTLRERYPGNADADRAIGAVQDVYRRNVFPAMNVSFGTYPSNIGHTSAQGCFRCHDGEKVTTDGQTIGQDCETCHAIE